MHVTLPKYRWQRNDWFNKRLPAWINLRWLGRGKRFSQAETVLTNLMKGFQNRPIDQLVFSGDVSALGYPEEINLGARLFGLVGTETLPGFAVPGNHDYTARDAAEGAFEREFKLWQEGQRIEDHIYPFAKKVGHVWLIGLNSATTNRMPWDASGAIGTLELTRLKRLCEQLDEGPKILVTHYPVCMSNGRLEARTHRLRNVREVTTVAREVGINLWLHGHRHVPYQLQSSPWTNFPIICGGSSTQNGLWSYGEYTIEGYHLKALRRSYNPETSEFQDQATFELDLNPK